MLQDEKYVNNFVIPHLDAIFSMIEQNIFRPLPCTIRANVEDEETGMVQDEDIDPAWPHL